MLGVADLYPPVAHHDAWWVVGVVALVAAVGVVVWAWLPKRPPRRPAAVNAEPVDIAAVKQRALDRFDELEQHFHQESLTARELHHELSSTLRQFAADLGPGSARAMTPVELFEAGLPELANVLHSYYPPRFAARAPSEPVAAIDAARTVVVQW